MASVYYVTSNSNYSGVWAKTHQFNTQLCWWCDDFYWNLVSKLRTSEQKVFSKSVQLSFLVFHPLTLTMTQTCFFFYLQIGSRFTRQEDPVPYMVSQPLPWQVHSVSHSRRSSKAEEVSLYRASTPLFIIAKIIQYATGSSIWCMITLVSEEKRWLIQISSGYLAGIFPHKFVFANPLSACLKCSSQALVSVWACGFGHTLHSLHS